ncbi:MAG TPA: hypothetical protein VF801_05520 [Rhodocyclaceae bacterium]
MTPGTVPPSTSTQGTRLILAVSITAVGAVTWAWWPDLGLGLATEQAPLGWLQSNWLIACATTAGLRASLAAHGGRGTAAEWTVLALAILAAALDERFMFHEQFQDLVSGELLDRGLVGDERAAERLAQSAILVYAVGGVAAAVWLRQAASASAWRWMRAAIGVGLMAIALDLASDAVAPQIIEELLEFAAETLMLCGLFTEARSAGSR